MGNTTSTPSSSSSLPPNHPSLSSAGSPPPGCPMHSSTTDAAADASSSSSSPSTSSSTNVLTDALNPLNNIPDLPQAPTHSSQKGALSLERTFSTIPRSRSNSDASSNKGACPVNHEALGEASSKGKGRATVSTTEDEDTETWVYPSPQQFYNALARKGKEAPEESVDMMVQIHNFLNERAWQEVTRWEDRRSPNERIELAKFEGRPQDLSPKARFHLFLGRLFPNTYNSEPPFDRHDWFVRRPSDGSFQRYVIDYYSCPNDEDGNPVFSLDVRPAVDSPGAVYERMTEWARLKKESWLNSESSGTTA